MTASAEVRPDFSHREIGNSSPTLSIIIIGYNTREMTLECIASVKAETQVLYEIIVVDNASSDGSAEAIRQAHPDVTLLAEDTNHGFGPAHAIALQQARAPWLLLLNPDTVVLHGAIDKLLAFARNNPEAKIWGGRTLFSDNSLNPASCFRKMTLWSIFCRVAGLNGLFRRSECFNSEYYGTWRRDSVRHVDIVSGCFFLVERKFWDELNGFDPVFTMYGEEVDFCLRARKRGAQPMVTPDATIVHYGGASERIPADKQIRVLRAKVELIKRHFPGWTRTFSLVVFRLLPLTRRAAYGFSGDVLRRPRLRENAEVWAEVWARRIEWQFGFNGPLSRSK